MDTVSKKRRSRIMAAIKSKNTKPEKAVRSALYKRGYRFRLHRKELPGTPDIVLFRHKTAIFVHGCFWHQHGCKHTSKPKTRKAYWNDKFAANNRRDKRNFAELRRDGWKVVVVWECEIRDDIDQVARRLDRILKRRLREIETDTAKDPVNDEKKKSRKKKSRRQRGGKRSR